jgi:hypothetical protein
LALIKYGATLRVMGQIETFNPDTIPPDQYTPEKGRYIAEAFADGCALREICDNSEGWLPSMLIVRRWRSMFPAFDALMCEAAACRAENMTEDILLIADDTLQQAAHNRNRMAAREKAAGWLAPAAYGSGKDNVPGDTEGAPVFTLTDEQLLAIAAGKLPALEGESVRIAGPEGVAPPDASAPGSEYEVSGLQKPGSSLAEHSVTTSPGSIESEKNFSADAEVVEPGVSFIGKE